MTDGKNLVQLPGLNVMVSVVGRLQVVKFLSDSPSPGVLGFDFGINSVGTKRDDNDAADMGH